MSNQLAKTLNWFETVDSYKEVTAQQIATQIGVHLEEVAEFLFAIEKIVDERGETGKSRNLIAAQQVIKFVSKELKTGEYTEELECLKAKTDNEVIEKAKVEMLDGLGDQIVTGTGVASRCNMDILTAMDRINESNFSKFDENGKPIFDENGKVGKSENYFKPVLEDLIK